MRTFNETITFFLECLATTEMGFNMQDWFYNGAPWGTPSAVEHTCGTSACIAGTVAAHLAPESEDHVMGIISDWVGAGAVQRCILRIIFEDSSFYGRVSITDATLEDVVTKLNEVKHMTWEDMEKSTK